MALIPFARDRKKKDPFGHLTPEQWEGKRRSQERLLQESAVKYPGEADMVKSVLKTAMEDFKDQVGAKLRKAGELENDSRIGRPPSESRENNMSE